MSERWPFEDATEPAEQSPAGVRSWADTALTRPRMAALAAVSIASCALLLWAAGPSAPSPGSVLAAMSHRTTLVAAAPQAAAPATPAPSTGTPTPTPKPQSSGATTHGASAPASTQTQPTQKTPSGATGSTGPTGTAGTTPSKIKHVFVVTLASPGYQQTWGTGSAASYLTTKLRPQGTLLSNYYAVGHGDLPNYIAMVSGQPPNPQTEQNCPTFAPFPAGVAADGAGVVAGSGCVYPVTTLTLGDQLTSSRHRWRAYAEDLSAGSPAVQACRHPGIGQPDPTLTGRPGDEYATRHNPFVYFHSLLDLGDCASNDLPLSALSGDLAAAAKTPSYSFIAPNLCNDGTDPTCANGSPGGLAAADRFLAQWVPKILASPAYHDGGLLAITFADAPAGDSAGCCGSTSGGGRVGTLIISPYAKAGATSSTPYNTYSLLRSVEDIFGVPHLADAGMSGVTSFGADVLRAG